MTQREAMPTSPHPPWEHWQPPVSLSLLGDHCKQSALGLDGDKDVWDTGRESGQLLSNLAILRGYKIILSPIPLSHSQAELLSLLFLSTDEAYSG